jgi:DNA-binding transcriptional regulator WhiA
MGLKHENCPIELNMVELPNYQRAVIIGLFLSHGWLSYASANNKYPRLGFE